MTLVGKSCDIGGTIDHNCYQSQINAINECFICEYHMLQNKFVHVAYKIFRFFFFFVHHIKTDCDWPHTKKKSFKLCLVHWTC